MRTKVALTLIVGLLLGNGAVRADSTPPPLPNPPSPAGKPTPPLTEAAPKADKPASDSVQDNVTVTIDSMVQVKILPVNTKTGKKIKLEMPGVTIEAASLNVKSEEAIFEFRVCADGGIQLRKFKDGNYAAPSSKPPMQADPEGIAPPPAAAPAAHERPMPTPSCGLFGNRLENFSLRDLEDKVWEYKRDRRGRLTLLNFWYHNCGPCLQSIPHLVELQRDFGPYGLEVIGIACETGTVEEQRAHVKPILNRKGVNYKVLLSGGGPGHCPVMEQFQVEYFPLLVLIDANGSILWRSPRGGMDDREYYKLQKSISDRLIRREP